MKLVIASVTPRRSPKSEPTQTLVAGYAARCTRFLPTDTLTFPTEAALLAASQRQPAQPAATLLLFDSTGDALTSQQFASALARIRDHGAQRLICAIGPADGWSSAALTRADRVISLGPMTLPHELARAVLAEQLYRALTILAGHPYHSGH